MNDFWKNRNLDPLRVRCARRFRYHVNTRSNPRGRIFRLPCVFCPLDRGTQQPSEAHHVDYAKPFLVAWLCEVHHRMVDHGSLKLQARMLCDYSGLVVQRRAAQKPTVVEEPERMVA